uniref:DUF4005 domain-containing protein n=1 Tax=Ananas comosus var. bracteatus TaxID=296719 RepID=A0A6V7PH62_ANACO|nr:unnamed protein product [Ananas comosus var. bracteatus]
MEKRDHGDHEPRVSDSASLPGYMKATESARAKVQASFSPKSSPDVHDDKISKRHSLPAGDGKQGHPHVLRGRNLQHRRTRKALALLLLKLLLREDGKYNQSCKEARDQKIFDVIDR